jgi:sulfur carrier protein ThiS
VTATLRPVGVLRTLGLTNGPRERTAVTVEDGQSLDSACLEVGVRPDLVALFLVNGRPESGGYVLQAGDDVKLVALVGGG